MQLLEPRRTSVLYRGIQEDDLVLYPNLMHNRLQRHVPLHELIKASSAHALVYKDDMTHLLLLYPLISTTLIRKWQNITSISVIHTIKLRAPHLNDLRQPLQQDSFNSLVQFGNPMFKVSIALQV